MSARHVIIISFGLLLLSGCYCRYNYNANSSVRFLRGTKSIRICDTPPGFGKGKIVLITAYTADPYFERLKFERNIQWPVNDLKFTQNRLFGLRAESFLALNGFPGPLLGLGLDYSYSNINALYSKTENKIQFNENQYIQTHYMQLSFNYVTWIRSRMMGYVGMQPGCAWSKRKAESPMVPYTWSDPHFKAKFTGRISYGFQFYFRPLSALNLEFGYGNGAFMRVGVNLWLW